MNLGISLEGRGQGKKLEERRGQGRVLFICFGFLLLLLSKLYFYFIVLVFFLSSSLI